MASEDPVAELFLVAPAGFVAARNALAKQLRAEGDRERAAEVAALRRPAVGDWALNVVAAERPAEVATFLAAAERSRQAQRTAASGAEGVDLRGALQELRAAMEAVVRAATWAAEGSPRAAPSAGPLSARLQEIAASADLSDQLHRGRLGSGEARADDLFDGDEPPDRPRPARGRRPGSRAAAQPSDRSDEVPPAAAAPDPARLSRLEQELAAADRAHQAARADLDAAAARFEAAERGVAAASAALACAQEDREHAGEAQARAKAAADAARRRLDGAAAALDRERAG